MSGKQSKQLRAAASILIHIRNEFLEKIKDYEHEHINAFPVLISTFQNTHQCVAILKKASKKGLTWNVIQDLIPLEMNFGTRKLSDPISLAEIAFAYNECANHVYSEFMNPESSIHDMIKAELQ